MNNNDLTEKLNLLTKWSSGFCNVAFLALQSLEKQIKNKNAELIWEIEGYEIIYALLFNIKHGMELIFKRVLKAINKDDKLKKYGHDVSKIWINIKCKIVNYFVCEYKKVNGTLLQNDLSYLKEIGIFIAKYKDYLGSRNDIKYPLNLEDEKNIFSSNEIKKSFPQFISEALKLLSNLTTLLLELRNLDIKNRIFDHENNFRKFN